MTKDEYDSAYLLGEIGDWTGDLVLLRFMEAVNTLRRLPEKWRPQSVRSASLPFVAYLDEEFEGVEPADIEHRREPLKKEAIDRMEEVFRWHAAWLSSPRMVEMGRALWMFSEAANGRYRIKRAAEKLGISPPTLHKRKEIGMHEVSDRLKNAEIPVLLPDYDLCLLLAVK